MVSRPLTDAETLLEIEALIESFRWARGDTAAPENKTYLALKAMADDLRGRQANRIGEAQAELQKAIDAAAKTKTILGYEINHLRRIAEETIGRWPVIRQALERFGANMGQPQ
ncbi:MAG TPA: hypothetical protein VN938_16365 [Xanthobacteraceae bacterium]|nr:hypothetical protein [Xanthobacteraceae bacterium]